MLVHTYDPRTDASEVFVGQIKGFPEMLPARRNGYPSFSKIDPVLKIKSPRAIAISTQCQPLVSPHSNVGTRDTDTQKYKGGQMAPQVKPPAAQADGLGLILMEGESPFLQAALSLSLLTHRNTQQINTCNPTTVTKALEPHLLWKMEKHPRIKSFIHSVLITRLDKPRENASHLHLTDIHKKTCAPGHACAPAQRPNWLFSPRAGWSSRPLAWEGRARPLATLLGHRITPPSVSSV